MPQQLTTTHQVNYLGQWFTSWSDMQKEDFLPILTQAYQPKDHINGLLGGLDSLSVQERRPSLFDCQVKLFHDWFATWTENEKIQMLELLRAADAEFMGQYDKKINGSSSDDTIPASENVDEGQNPPSSVSSPPSTLPRSHSPHDSGLDEPPSDSDHTEPHSLESSHEPEDRKTPTSETTAAPPPLPAKTLGHAPTTNEPAEGIVNGCGVTINSASPEPAPAPVLEGQADQ